LVTKQNDCTAMRFAHTTKALSAIMLLISRFRFIVTADHDSGS
jgi:hypothetical protein